MIKREIALKQYGWIIVCFIGYSTENAVYLCQELSKIGCTGKAVSEAYNHFIKDAHDCGLTYSNVIERKSLVAIGNANDQANIVNTIAHEMFHVVAHICGKDNIDMQGEEPCYIMGELCEKVFKELELWI